MNSIRNAKKTLKQEASINAILFSTEERRLFKRTILSIVASVILGYAVASLLFNWWIALIGLAGLTAVSIAPIIRWNRKRFVRAFFDICRDSGSAEVLTGKVHYAVVFVRPNQRSKNRVDHALEELRKSFEYLSAEAHRYGKRVVFENILEDPLLLVLRRPKTTGRHRLERSFINELSRNLSRLPMAEMAHNKHFFVIVFTTGGDYRACAIPRTRFNARPSSLEFCVCPDGNTSTMIAHEILHLFGARDLYFEGEVEDEERKLLDIMVERARTYTHDHVFNDAEADNAIMAHPLGKPDALIVTPATAYAVGWLNKLPSKTVR